jgi:hypothetical protein
MPNRLELSCRAAQADDVRAVRECIRALVMGTDRRASKEGARQFWELGEGPRPPSGGPILTAYEWVQLAPFLAVRNGRTWRRLPELRRKLRGWEVDLDDGELAERWPLFLFDACCALPEEIPLLRCDKRKRDTHRDELAAALAGQLLLPSGSQTVCQRPSDDEFEPGYEYRDIVPPVNGGVPVWFSYRHTARLAAQGKEPDPRNWVVPGLLKVVDPHYHERLGAVASRWRGRHPGDYMVGFTCDQIIREKTPEERAGLAGALMCAAKAAVWQRAHEYLAAYGRPSGTEPSPAQRRAAYVQPSWLEFHSNEPDLEVMLQSLTPDYPRQKNTHGQGESQLAAALELAADDLALENLLDPGMRHFSDVWDAQCAADRILDQLVVVLRQGPDLDDLVFRRTRPASPLLLRINLPSGPLRPKPNGSSEPQQPLEEPSQRWLFSLAGLAAGSNVTTDRLRWVYDPENTQSVMHYLRTKGGHDRFKLTLGLLQAVTACIMYPANRDSAVLRGQMRVVNSAAWDVAAANDARLFRFTEPLLGTVRPIDSPFVGTLYRSQATLATKSNDHRLAFNRILAAGRAIRAAGDTTLETGDLERINYIEALQQVTLQKAGAEIRALETFLRSPRHKFAVSREDERDFCRFAEHLSAACVRSAVFAYICLANLEQDPLPATPQIGRVSTAAWRFNTRYQAARAAILRALILAALREPMSNSLKPGEEMMAVAARFYQEALAVAKGRQQICLLTQIALTYALITGGRFLNPGDSPPDNVPAYMVMPLADDLFDWESASAYLVNEHFSPGPMLNLTWRRADVAIRRQPEKIYAGWLHQWAVPFRESNRLRNVKSKPQRQAQP